MRRIINDDGRLKIRLDELTEDFYRCGYPKKMLKKMFDKVMNTPRSLDEKQKSPDSENEKLMVISTYGRDRPLIDVIEKN